MLEELLDLCESQYNQRDYENLIKTCDEVQEIEKDEPASLNYKAISYYYLEEYDRAMEILKHCLKLHPTNHYTLNNMALIHIAQGEYEKALECCEKGLKSRELGWLQINKIESLIHLGRVDEAQKYYQSIQIPYYTFEEALDNCGVGDNSCKEQYEKLDVLLKEEKFDEVLQLCNEMGSTEKTIDYKVVSLIRLKRLEEAEKCIDEAIESYPYNHCFYFIKAKISTITQNIDEAIENYEKAFRIDGLSNNRLEINDYNNCLEIKSHILIENREYEDAVKTLEKIITVKQGELKADIS